MDVQGRVPDDIGMFMNLSVFLNIKFYFDGTNYTADERYFEFWVSFTEYFERVILCVPVLESVNRKGKFRVTIDEDKIKICHLPFYSDSIQLYKRSPFLINKLRRILSDNISQWDVVGAVVPNLIGLFSLFVAKRHSKACFAYVRGNHKKAMNYEFEGPKKWIAYIIACSLEIVLKKLALNTLTFTVGKESYNILRRKDNPVFDIVVSLISIRDIKKEVLGASNRLQKVRILYVGWIEPWKGVGYLIEGLNQLKNKYGCDFTLTIVGSGSTALDLRKKVQTLGLSDSVRFTGYIPYGPDIIEFYRKSDLFVLPSLSEGVPKTILETMANGVPIIATSVGGIPEIIKNGVNGVLVPPADSTAIADAIFRCINGGELRANLAKNGLETIKEYTLEKQRDKIINIMKSYYGLNLIT
jgi:glycosyltransferase involved in cell wall biosynthesis